MTSLPDETATLAGRFLAARRAAEPLRDFPGALPETLREAYAVQDAAIAAWGRPVVGWKVGRINPPHAARLQADRLAGPIFLERNAASDGGAPTMPVFEGGFAAAEAEFLLRIGRAPPADQTAFSLDEAAGLIDSIHVGIEVASSPLRAINELGPTSVVSDFGNNNGILVGEAIGGWRSSGFEDWPVTTLIDGVAVGSGQARDFPDGAIGAARFLFELMAARGIALRPGQWISSGAVSGVHEARPGQRIEARFGESYRVRCTLSAAQPE